MFGYVTASLQELSEAQRRRYRAVYCGICHRIGTNASGCCRVCLTYDMVFLALLLSSLYEPEEQTDESRCIPHPFSRQTYVDSPVISYAADMNIALGYYSADDHWRDERRLDARMLAAMLGPHRDAVAVRHPRQCQTIVDCLEELRRLETEHCANPDLPASVFGKLLGEIFVYREDHWAAYLRQVGYSLGRFIYLADAVMDLERDRRKGNYNPCLAAGEEIPWAQWEEHLTVELADCTRAFEHLPLVQDKALMDNILYSGVWLTYRHKEKKGHRRT